jgi:hypothetical protein
MPRTGRGRTGRSASAGGTEVTRAGTATDPDLLLSAVLQDFDPDQEQAAERQILHDADPAHALAALSRQCALLVVALNSDPTVSIVSGAAVTMLIERTPTTSPWTNR